MTDRPILELVLDDAMFSVARHSPEEWEGMENKKRYETGKRLLPVWLSASKEGFPLEDIVEKALKKGRLYAEELKDRAIKNSPYTSPPRLNEQEALSLMQSHTVAERPYVDEIAEILGITGHTNRESFLDLLTPFFEGMISAFYLNIDPNVSHNNSKVYIHRYPEDIHLSNGNNSQISEVIILQSRGGAMASLSKYFEVIREAIPRKISEVGSDGQLDLKEYYGNAPEYAFCLIGFGRGLEIIAEKCKEKYVAREMLDLAGRAYIMSGFANTDYVKERIECLK